ncbi:SAM-dependent methyltransferase [Streptomyces qinglanensis]|uniref:SAM-dependent methyltransferase n=1 Tax=Streptomyces qinglanensis TaxID=943816 RepID=UPI003D730A8C
MVAVGDLAGPECALRRVDGGDTHTAAADVLDVLPLGPELQLTPYMRQSLLIVPPEARWFERFGADGWAHLRPLRDLQRAGAAGVALPSTEAPQALVEAARHAGLPLLVAREPALTRDPVAELRARVMRDWLALLHERRDQPADLIQAAGVAARAASAEPVLEYLAEQHRDGITLPEAALTGPGEERWRELAPRHTAKLAAVVRGEEAEALLWDENSYAHVLVHPVGFTAPYRLLTITRTTPAPRHLRDLTRQAATLLGMLLWPGRQETGPQQRPVHSGLFEYLLLGEVDQARRDLPQVAPLLDSEAVEVCVLECDEEQDLPVAEQECWAALDAGVVTRSPIARQIIVLRAIPGGGTPAGDLLEPVASASPGRRIGAAAPVAWTQMHTGYADALQGLALARVGKRWYHRTSRTSHAVHLPAGARVWARALLAERVPAVERRALVAATQLALSHGIRRANKLVGAGSAPQGLSRNALQQRMHRLADLLHLDIRSICDRGVLHLVLTLAHLPVPDHAPEPVSFLDALRSESSQAHGRRLLRPLLAEGDTWPPESAPLPERLEQVLAWATSGSVQEAANALSSPLGRNWFSARKLEHSWDLGLSLAPPPWDGSYEVLLALASTGCLDPEALTDPADPAPAPSQRSTLARFYRLLLAGDRTDTTVEATDADFLLLEGLEDSFGDMHPSANAHEDWLRTYARRAVSGDLPEFPEGFSNVLDLGRGYTHPWKTDLATLLQGAAEEVRYVGVDIDTGVIADATAQIGSTQTRRFLVGDVTEPEALLREPAVRSTLDLDRPVCVAAGVTWQFNRCDISDMVARYLDLLPAGSCVVMTQTTTDVYTEPTLKAIKHWRRHFTYNVCSRAQLFETLTGPARVTLTDPRSDGAAHAPLAEEERIATLDQWGQPARTFESKGNFPVFGLILFRAL